MATGTKYNSKQDLLDAITAGVNKDGGKIDAELNLQKAYKDVIETIYPNIGTVNVVDTAEYTVVNASTSNKFIAILKIKGGVVQPGFTVDIVPAGLGQFFYFQQYLQTVDNTDHLIQSTTEEILFNKLLSEGDSELFTLLGRSKEGYHVILNNYSATTALGGTAGDYYTHSLPNIESNPITLTYSTTTPAEVKLANYTIILEGLIT